MASQAVPDVPYDRPIPVEWKVLAALRVESPTITNVEAAKRIGVNHVTVNLWVRNPAYQRYESWVLRKAWEDVPIDARSAEASVRETIEDAAPEMTARLLEIIRMTDDPKLEAELCRDMLDRAGFAAQRKVPPSAMRPVILTGEAMEVFMRRAREAGLPSGRGDVINIEEIEDAS